MNKHSDIQLKLYDYLKHELSEIEREEVEKHLPSCGSCAKEAEELNNLMNLLPSESYAPSGERAEEFWNNFPLEVEQKIHSLESSQEKFSTSWVDRLYSFLIEQNKPVVVFGSILVVLIGAFGLWRLNLPNSRPENIESQVAQPSQESEIDQKISQYFRKSKILLTGISNMDFENNHPIDLSTERKISRELVHQARYLKEQPLDINSARLIKDLEKIQIELANLKDATDFLQVQIVRSGIHKGNLIFKIRMAESMYDESKFENVSNTYKGDLK